MTCKRKKWKAIKNLTWYETKCICIINKKPITLNLLKQAKKLKKNQNPDGVLSVRGLVKDKTWQKKKEKKIKEKEYLNDFNYDPKQKQLIPRSRNIEIQKNLGTDMQKFLTVVGGPFKTWAKNKTKWKRKRER